MSTTDYPVSKIPVAALLSRWGCQIGLNETPQDREIKKILSQIKSINEEDVSLEEKVRQAIKLKLPKSFYWTTQTFYFTFYKSTGNIGYTPDEARSFFKF